MKACQIDVFDFLKVTETFVKCSGLPPALKRHLSGVEEAILDRHCWDEGSKLTRVLAEEVRG